ncbi:DUF7661 family protein [Shewanella sedimentimangrovi]|uniref:DUF7661 domain-containing protein n=1 Tax=Shewanella sedimentimangrovi TaxID=2814293 RepID=A0ABX7R3J8_9GAMM|nr:hypothetical protein [Shewanella sedimentimangrovi]QSX38399.1 hypothetical protein JYB85_06145 [Shewanella sedimentimangrovi]
MKFDIFGKKILEVTRIGDEWRACYCGTGGVKRKAEDIRIPAGINEAELEDYIADIFHEWATPGRDRIVKLS